MFMAGINNCKKIYNKPIWEYCVKSTQDSIRKMTEKYNLEKEKIFIKFKLDDSEDDNKKPVLNSVYGFLVILSVSSLGIFLYKKLK